MVDKRMKGTIVGLGFIAFGVVGAIYNYVQDGNSFDIIRMGQAGPFAMLHLMLWSLAGLGIIAWYQLKPADGARNADDPPDRFRG